MNKNYFFSIGKRKTSIAKLYLKEGSGIIIINGKSIETYFNDVLNEAQRIKAPLILAGIINKYDISTFVNGGGIMSQLEAIQLAIARVICKLDIKFRIKFKEKNFLTRDSRIKERRKYGLKKARKASQFSKR